MLAEFDDLPEDGGLDVREGDFGYVLVVDVLWKGDDRILVNAFGVNYFDQICH